jgi:ABC-type Fe3+-siderophore transport system permease subunit
LWFVGLIIAIVLFRRREPRAKYVLIAAIAGALITPIAIITSIVG